MDKEEIFFIKITENLIKKHKNVKLGKMMSAPGIKFHDKVFAFYYNHEMVFRLGSTADPKEIGIKKFYLLNPFKNKAPMKNCQSFQREFQMSFLPIPKTARMHLHSTGIFHAFHHLCILLCV